MLSLLRGEKKGFLCKLSDRNYLFFMISPEHVALNKIGCFIKYFFLCYCRYIIKGETLLFFSHCKDIQSLMRSQNVLHLQHVLALNPRNYGRSEITKFSLEDELRERKLVHFTDFDWWLPLCNILRLYSACIIRLHFYTLLCCTCTCYSCSFSFNESDRFPFCLAHLPGLYFYSYMLRFHSVRLCQEPPLPGQSQDSPFQGFAKRLHLFRSCLGQMQQAVSFRSCMGANSSGVAVPSALPLTL